MSRFSNARRQGETNTGYFDRLTDECEIMISEIRGKFPWIAGQCECDSPLFTPDAERICEHCARFVNFQDDHDAEEHLECLKLPHARGESDDIERFGKR